MVLLPKEAFIPVWLVIHLASENIPFGGNGHVDSRVIHPQRKMKGGERGGDTLSTMATLASQRCR